MGEPARGPIYTAPAEAEAILEMAVADMVALLGGGKRGRFVAAVMLIRRARQLQRDGAEPPPEWKIG